MSALLRSNGTGPLDDLDRELLRRLVTVGVGLRVTELVNENREHEMNAAEVERRLLRLHALGYVRPTYWVATADGKAETPPRFAPSEVAGKRQAA